MILATKHLDLDACPLRVAALTLRELQASGGVALEDLEATVRARLGDAALANIAPALGFLFLAGALHYDSGTHTVVMAKRANRAPR